MFAIETWTDTFASWRHEVEVERGAGRDVTLEGARGAAIFLPR